MKMTRRVENVTTVISAKNMKAISDGEAADSAAKGITGASGLRASGEQSGRDEAPAGAAPPGREHSPAPGQAPADRPSGPRRSGPGAPGPSPRSRKKWASPACAARLPGPSVAHGRYRSTPGRSAPTGPERGNSLPHRRPIAPRLPPE